ncbi:MAG: LeuA family protein, partial [Proteobacteria bacterium]|nr:LeuA family protein [Pseudomonadota bacterium]
MLIDTTLREGEQLFGAYFTPETRRTILKHLHTAGVEEAEVGCVGRDGLAELLAWAREHCPGMALGVWCPCREEALTEAAGLDTDRVNVGVPVSDLHLEDRLGWSRQDLIAQVRSIVGKARALGVPYLSLGLEDATRADPVFVVEVARVAHWHGAARVRLSDTVGHGTPDQIRELVQRVGRSGVTVAVHCHNDFGMGTANAVTALRNGATFADGTLLGIGERAGIAATEELAAYLRMGSGQGAYVVEHLCMACELVSARAGVSIARTKPVVGTDIFCCETGLHLDGLGKNPALFEPYAP